MKKLIYEDVNLQTGHSYSVYTYFGAHKQQYLVYECDQDGNMKCIEEFTSCDDAVAFVRKKCK
jgi:hypothetical protein